MTISRVFYIFGWITLLTFTTIFLDEIFGLGISNDAAFETFIAPFVMLVSFVLTFPYLRKRFTSWFILDKGKIHQAICLPILAAIAMGFAVNIYRYIPYWLGSDPIGVGSNQVTSIEDITQVGLTLLTSIIGPLNEELMFRFLIYVGLFYLLTKNKNRYPWLSRLNANIFTFKNPIYILGLVCGINVLFALVHGPNLLNFPLYFLGGAVNTLFFIRYGFLSAWISHGVFNFFSGITLSIVVQTMV
ncbi:type II CAAX prenyl endopeptidase Rce1 family protein [Priestia aryabhattai]|uniref:CPBP family glutamic-type intramembrane protease n=1 Tax=Priestia aryabhattai TaxID=412384 RepID=UPI00398F65F4